MCDRVSKNSALDILINFLEKPDKIKLFISNYKKSQFCQFNWAGSYQNLVWNLKTVDVTKIRFTCNFVFLQIVVDVLAHTLRKRKTKVVSQKNPLWNFVHLK